MELEAIDGFPGIIGRRRDFKPHDESPAVSFMEYRGGVPPSNSLGNPGDIYIDNVAFLLYACYDFTCVNDRWYAWSSTKFQGTDVLEHPEHRDLILWVNGEASWWRRRRLENRFGKKRFLKTPKDFVRDFVQKTKSKGKLGSSPCSASQTAPTTAPPALGSGIQSISQSPSSMRPPISAVASNRPPKAHSKHTLPPIQRTVSQPVEPLIGLDWIVGGEDGDRSWDPHEENKVLKRKLRELEEENVRLRNGLSQPAIPTNESESMAFPSPPPSTHPGLSESRSISVVYSPAPSVKDLPPRIPKTSKKRKRALSPPITIPTPRPVPPSLSPSLELRRFPTPPTECPASPELLAPPVDRIFTSSPPPSPKVVGNSLGKTAPSPAPTPSVPCPPSPVLETGLKKRRIARSGEKRKVKVEDVEMVMPAVSQSRRRNREPPSVSHSLSSLLPADSVVKSTGKERQKRKEKKVNPPPQLSLPVLPAVSTSARQLKQKTCTPHPRTNSGPAASTSAKVKEQHVSIRQPLSRPSASVAVNEVIDLTMDSDDETTTKLKVIVVEDSDDEIKEVEKPNVIANTGRGKGKEKAGIFPDGAELDGTTPLLYPFGTSRDEDVSELTTMNVLGSSSGSYSMSRFKSRMFKDTVKVKVELSEAERFPLAYPNVSWLH